MVTTKYQKLINKPLQAEHPLLKIINNSLIDLPGHHCYGPLPQVLRKQYYNWYVKALSFYVQLQYF